MISIIGGRKKRTIIKVPSNKVRPTSSQKREAIFSIIESYGLKMNINFYKKTNILDLFAGSGSLGLEAISRGAAFVYFYENNKNVILDLKSNCLKICNNNFKIKKENIFTSTFKDINKKISLVFIDPPYNIEPFEKILDNINNSAILKKNAVVVLEYSKNSKIKIPSFFSCFNEKKYGKTKISFLIKKIK